MDLRAAVQISELELDRMLLDRYGLFGRLHGLGDLFQIEEKRLFLITAHHLIETGLKESVFSSNRLSSMAIRLQAESSASAELLLSAYRGWLMYMDPPEHAICRTMVNSSIATTDVGDAISSITFQGIPRRRATNIVAEIIIPTVSTFLARIMGIELAFYESLRRSSQTVLGFFVGTGLEESDPSPAAAADAYNDMKRTLESLPQSRGLLAELRRHAVDSVIDFGSLATALIADTWEPVVASAAAGVLYHLRGMVPNNHIHKQPVETFDEIVRLESPFQFCNRVATATLEFGGSTLHQNDRVIFCLGAGNRDPRVFPDPNAFVLRPNYQQSLAFGVGRHNCLGRQIARQFCIEFWKQLFANERPSLPELVDYRWRDVFGMRILDEVDVYVPEKKDEPG